MGIIKRLNTISKTSFIRGLQCPRSFYLYKFHPELRDAANSELQHIFRMGTGVGLLARGLFPGGTDAYDGEHDRFRESITATGNLIKRGETVIYEAGFLHDNLLCFIDILVKRDGIWRGYEVKSSTGIRDTYLMDASFQFHVIRGSGLPVEEIYIVYINNRYRRREKLDIKSLFNFKPVTAEAVANKLLIEEKAAGLTEILKNCSDPLTGTGEHCFRPYTCDFMSYCWKDYPDDPVFNISGLNRNQAITLYKNGSRRIPEIPDNYPLKPGQKIQVDCHRTGKVHADIKKLSRFIYGLKYPLGFLDFESTMDPVPDFPGTRPYQHIPFQYSIHIQEKPGSEPSHYSFLGNPGIDPRRELVEKLLGDINREGDILVYNRPYENSRLKELAAEFPEYSHEIKKIKARLKDLMKPFQNRYFYSPMMNGSYSMKNILPALVPELSYRDLQVSNGFQAMNTYNEMKNEKDDGRINTMRENLLQYCMLDTFGMVKILEKLGEYII